MDEQAYARFHAEYKMAILQFNELRDQCRRTDYLGQNFILHPTVTSSLRDRSPLCVYSSDLERLFMSAYMYRSGEFPPVGLTLERVEERYLQILYILTDIDCPHLLHLFAQHGLNNDQLPILESTLRDKLPWAEVEHIPEFYEKFYATQFEWCPAEFELDMAWYFGYRVLPIYHREEIKPRRDMKAPTGVRTTVWSVEVAEEMIGPELRKKLPRSEMDESDGPHKDNNPGKRWKFALKMFPILKNDKDGQFWKNKFESELKMFKVLKDKDGIIQYYGWFHAYNSDYNSSISDYYIIMLELADCDLYEAFREQSSPIAPDEIQRFWQGMLDVSKALRSIHDDTQVQTVSFKMWHGDVKPENILVVGNLYKLADPGEATLQIAMGQKLVSRTDSGRGTRTYAAPEKVAELDGHLSSELSANFDEGTDVWSLGCVFSVAATFVCHDTQGVQQYDGLRTIAHDQASLSPSDDFHNGFEVLPEVKEWHDYLRATLRGTDAFTAKVLEMVDDHMLVSADDRWTAHEVCEHMEKLLTAPVFAYEVPGRVQQLLGEIERRREEFENLLEPYASPDDPAQTSENIPPRRTPTVRSMQAQGKKDSDRIYPTAQRSQARPSFTGLGIPASNIRVQPPPRTGTGSSGTIMGPPALAYAAQETPRPSVVAIPALDENTTSIFALHGELKRMNKPRSLVEARSKLGPLKFFNKKNKQAAAKAAEHHKAMLENPEDQLGPFLKGRDIIIIVDNGSSMYRHWMQVKYVAEILVWRALGYDDDGMEMYFTNPDTAASVKPRDGRSDQSVVEFIQAMDSAHPESPSPKRPGGTNIVPTLNRYMNEYMAALQSKKPPKNLTIIVMTDGAWEAMPEASEYHVDNTIENHLRLLMDFWQHKGNPRDDLQNARPLTIQFIRFGHNRRGIERLRRLDDDLRQKELPDLIDTEPADGDAYKMIRGSLSDAEDSRQTVHSSVENSNPVSPAGDGASYFSRPSRTNSMYSQMTMQSPNTVPDARGGFAFQGAWTQDLQHMPMRPGSQASHPSRFSNPGAPPSGFPQDEFGSANNYYQQYGQAQAQNFGQQEMAQRFSQQQAHHQRVSSGQERLYGASHGGPFQAQAGTATPTHSDHSSTHSSAARPRNNTTSSGGHPRPPHQQPHSSPHGGGQFPVPPYLNNH